MAAQLLVQFSLGICTAPVVQGICVAKTFASSLLFVWSFKIILILDLDQLVSRISMLTCAESLLVHGGIWV